MLAQILCLPSAGQARVAELLPRASSPQPPSVNQDSGPVHHTVCPELRAGKAWVKKPVMVFDPSHSRIIATYSPIVP